MIQSGFVPVDASGLNSKYQYLLKEDIDIDESKLIQFFENNLPEVLVCYDAVFGGRKTYSKVNDKFSEIMKTTKTLFPNVDIRVDSGGFQINVGVYDRQKSLDLMEYYYEYINNFQDSYDKCFILDLCPGSNSIAFNNWDEVESWNKKSYRIASESNDKKNLVFIFQMYTQEIEKIWSKLLDEHFDRYEWFSVGGIASNKGKVGNKAIGFAMAIFKTLRKAIETGRKELNFHFLGGKQYNYILIFELLKRHIKEVFNIDFNYTFDSSGYARYFTQYKTYEHFDNETNKAITFDLRSLNLDKRVRDNDLTQDLFLKYINEVCTISGINFKVTDIYNSKGKSDSKMNFFSNLLILSNYRKVQLYIRSELDELYDGYKNNQESFCNKVGDILLRLNSGGRISKHQKQMTTDMLKSLDLIRDMNLDYYNHILGQTAVTLWDLDGDTLTI